MRQDTGRAGIRATLFIRIGRDIPGILEVRMLKLLSVCAGLGVVAMAAALSAQGQPEQNPVELKVGDVAPPFALQGSDGKIHKLSDSKGKTVVLAWFPKAFTGG
jgi:cytochrome oxidase Cu insertion factor (SCO1/SenC/PrrC family)